MRIPTNGATNNAVENSDQIEHPSAKARLLSSRRAGDYAPEFRLSDTAGQVVSLFATLKAGPAVLSFLDTQNGRDPSSQIRALNDQASKIAEIGASILAVLPVMAWTSSETLELSLLLDTGHGIASAYGLYPPPRTRQYQLATPGPVPATFVIGQNTKIVMSLTDAAFDSPVVSANVLSTLEALRLRRDGKP